MVALLNAAPTIDRREDVEALRLALEAMRREAGQEISRLNRKLAEREYDAERIVATAAERQAMEQELSTLQSTLNEKEQVLDRITDECRRLEDELEDRHLVFDDLREEVARKDLSLKEAREEVERLQLALEELRERPSASTTPASPTVPTAPVPNVRSSSVGLLSGLMVLAVVGLAVWGGTRVDMTFPWKPLVVSRPLVDQPAPGSGSGSVPEPLAAPGAADQTGPVERSAPLVSPPVASRPTQRDALRVGGQGPTLVALEGGAFRMGHNSLSGADYGPEHQVQVPPFLIGAYEVTFEQYDHYARAAGRPLPPDFGFGRGTRPVVGVTWSEASAYADWLSRQTGERYRLPTEAEWEYAARSGGEAHYPWGFGMERGRAVCFDCGTSWDNRSSAPVGSFDPNPFGLHDTAGNALEWVADCYHSGYQGAPVDGGPVASGDCDRRVARGGAFNKPSASMRAYVRASFVPETRLNMLGFRVARKP